MKFLSKSENVFVDGIGAAAMIDNRMMMYQDIK